MKQQICKLRTEIFYIDKRSIMKIELGREASEAVKVFGICLATAIASAATKDPACLWALILVFFV